MKVIFTKPEFPKAGTVAVLVDKDGGLSGPAADLDTALDGAVARAVKVADFKGEAAAVLELIAVGEFDRVVLLGAGDQDGFDRATAEKIGGALAASLANAKVREANLVIGDQVRGDLGSTALAVAIASGVRLRRYGFSKYSARRKEAEKTALGKLSVAVDKASAARRGYAGEEAVLNGVDLARDLVSEPANMLYPESFAKRIEAALSPLGVEVEILGEKQMRKLGMGALLGVGQGSARDSQLVVMCYDGIGEKPKKTTKGKARADKPSPVSLALVGKGVTFDTGGISIKPAGGMEDMKWDMGGAAAVVGAMAAIAGRQAKTHVVGVVGLVENMPDGNAQRPGDVVTAADGQTIEVINTDAEGRLVLADALWYTQDRFAPGAIVDLATLTGAIITALGHEYAGLFTPDDALADKLLGAGQESGDHLWRLPLGPAYDKMLDSEIADMKNVGGRSAGSITAAQFLKRFVAEGTPWAHLDVAGTVWSSKDLPTSAKGGTGFGVRLLDRLVASHFEG